MELKETTEAIAAAIDFAVAIKRATADGKLSIKDFPYFVAVWPALLKGLGGAHKIPRELKDLSEVEQKHLAVVVKDILLRRGLGGERGAKIAELALRVINYEALRGLIGEI